MWWVPFARAATSWPGAGRCTLTELDPRGRAVARPQISAVLLVHRKEEQRIADFDDVVNLGRLGSHVDVRHQFGLDPVALPQLVLDPGVEPEVSLFFSPEKHLESDYIGNDEHDICIWEPRPTSHKCYMLSRYLRIPGHVSYPHPRS